MSYTNIPKPTTQTYTNLNPAGKEQYDQADITYDSTIVYYDGIIPNQYTGILKPLGSLSWFQAIIPWSQATFPWADPTPYTKVAKPI